MIWLTWRQHRGEAIGVAALLSALGVTALVTGLPMHRAYARDGVAACQQAADPGTGACMQVIDSFRDQFAGVPMQIAAQLHFLPVIAGILIGVPFLAREYEHGTWQLAWTQAVPRSRWLIAKLALVLPAITVAALALSALLNWWLRPLVPSQFRAERFNYAALVLPTYFLLAVAIGIVAGALIRRTIPAMVATIVVFLPIRLFVEFELRPRFMAPVTAVDPVPGSRALVQQVSDGKNWVLDTFLIGPSGNRLTDAEEYDLFGRGRSVDEAVTAKLGIKEAVTYHPAERFWEFQLIETAIFGGLAAVLITLVVWRVRR
jgi:uncharacterized membrane protein